MKRYSKALNPIDRPKTRARQNQQAIQQNVNAPEAVSSLSSSAPVSAAVPATASASAPASASSSSLLPHSSSSTGYRKFELKPSFPTNLSNLVSRAAGGGRSRSSDQSHQQSSAAATSRADSNQQNSHLLVGANRNQPSTLIIRVRRFDSLEKIEYFSVAVKISVQSSTKKPLNEAKSIIKKVTDPISGFYLFSIHSELNSISESANWFDARKEKFIANRIGLLNRKTEPDKLILPEIKELGALPVFTKFYPIPLKNPLKLEPKPKPQLKNNKNKGNNTATTTSTTTTTTTNNNNDNNTVNNNNDNRNELILNCERNLLMTRINTAIQYNTEPHILFTTSTRERGDLCYCTSSGGAKPEKRAQYIIWMRANSTINLFLPVEYELLDCSVLDFKSNFIEHRYELTTRENHRIEEFEMKFLLEPTNRLNIDDSSSNSCNSSSASNSKSASSSASNSRSQSDDENHNKKRFKIIHNKEKEKEKEKEEIDSSDDSDDDDNGAADRRKSEIKGAAAAAVAAATRSSLMADPQLLFSLSNLNSPAPTPQSRSPRSSLSLTNSNNNNNLMPETIVDSDIETTDGSPPAAAIGNITSDESAKPTPLSSPSFINFPPKNPSFSFISAFTDKFITSHRKLFCPYSPIIKPIPIMDGIYENNEIIHPNMISNTSNSNNNNNNNTSNNSNLSLSMSMNIQNNSLANNPIQIIPMIPNINCSAIFPLLSPLPSPTSSSSFSGGGSFSFSSISSSGAGAAVVAPQNNNSISTLSILRNRSSE